MSSNYWWGHIWIHCLQKSVLLSSVLFLLSFYETFSIPVKNEEYGEGHFMRNELNKKNSEHPFCKKANLWTFEVLTDFFWSFYEKLKLMKVKNVQPEVNVFCGQFCQEV